MAKKLKGYWPIVLALPLLLGLAIAARAHLNTVDHPAEQEESQQAKGEENDENKKTALTTISPFGHQAIKASVKNDNPEAYTINVKKMANLNVNEDAPTFAVYTKGSLPQKCGDFRDLELPYKKPSKYERVFDLSEHENVLKAIDQYGCVVMRNIPPAKG